MAGKAPAPHEHWGSQFGFLMAAVGSSVGLGNFWRFPYTAGENGGSLFIIIYILCIILVAYPVLVAEYAIGRRGQHNAVRSIREVAREAGVPGLWAIGGWVGMMGAFLILTFYSVVAGWVLVYVFKAFSGAFIGQDAAAIGGQFSSLIGEQQLVVVGAHAAFMLATVAIVARGISGGIEVAVKILMPAFFVMLLGVVIFGSVVGDLGAAVSYLTEPDITVVQTNGALDFNKVSNIVSEALGQAFFSVGVGVGLMITYGSYLNKTENIVNSSRTISGADTFVALIAGLAIFPIALGFGQDPAGGPGLFFVTLPVAFAQLPVALSIAVAGVFFLLALFAALTSSISLLEVSAAWLEEASPLSKRGATYVLGALCFLIGLGSVFSMGFFDFVDQLTGKVMLPLGGLIIAIFAGWIVKKELFRDELSQTNDGAFASWRFLLRWPATVGALLIFINSIYAFSQALPALWAGVVGG